MVVEKTEKVTAASSGLPVHFSPQGLAISPSEQCKSKPFIPPYLKQFPSHLGPEDREYLYNKGALSIPELELRDALLRSYAQYIHPTLPFLDLSTYQASIQDPVRNGQASLTLFQAVMFAGSAWVDITYLRKLGFLTRKAARKAFYIKARVSCFICDSYLPMASLADSKVATV